MILICCGYSKISHFLERILMEHKDMKNSLDSKLQVCCICFIQICSRKRDIFEKPLQHNSKQCIIFSHNPFLFSPYQRLCQIGRGVDPEQVFNMSKYPAFELNKCLSPYKSDTLLSQVLFL